MTKVKTLSQKVQDILLETPREIHKCIEEGDEPKAFRILSGYANQRVIEFLIEIKNECFDKPGDTFQEAYAYLCLKIIDKIKELKQQNED